MDFSRIYDGVKSKKKLEFLFPDDSVFSYPVMARRDNRLYDSFFVYKENVAVRPFGWAMLSADKGEVCAASNCAAADFINPAEYPLDSGVDLSLPREIDSKKLKAMQSEIASVYSQMREFVFEESLNREQVVVVIKYKDLFMQLCPKGLYPFYHALSPAFFHWLRLPLPEASGLSAQTEQKQDDTRVYQHQLLILENLQQLVRQFNEKIAADDYREKLFDSLHKEAQEYKNGLLEALTRHMELDVIRIIDDLVKTLEIYKDKPRDSENYEKLYSMLRGVEIDLRDLLYRQGADSFNVPGEDTDVSRQNIVTTVQSDDMSLDRKIASRLSEGWEKSGKIIRPERVSVYIYSGGQGGQAL